MALTPEMMQKVQMERGLLTVLYVPIIIITTSGIKLIIVSSLYNGHGADNLVD